ncbi:hypothetical protein [Streptomyces aureus]|uniref:hypothetical protein n=1 Tax=Streptomyces aureus TaxID=193461 RepID=UPI0033D8E4DF
MDRFALCRALVEAGVPAALYEIADCPGDHRAADRYFLAGRAGDWTVGVHERGVREVFEHFADEDAACRWLYDRLLAPERAPAPGPEAPAGPGPGPEELQRRADEDLETALAEQRRRADEQAARESHENPAGGDASG